MKLYLIAQDYQGYDTFDAVIVAARTELEAYEQCTEEIYAKSKTIRIIAKETSEPLGIIASYNAG